MKKIFRAHINLAVLLFGLAALPLAAQVAAPPPAPDYQPLPADQMDQLLGPIALYPDPLMAQILPAATLPTQIVLAERYVSGGGDPNQIDQQPWDPSVQAIARYPNVLQWMDQNLDWTTEVGQAFINQQQDVMDSIQRLRSDAYNVGNLQSTPQQQVVNDSGQIEILPSDPNQIYLPDYQPDYVYYQPGYAVAFGPAFPIGFWLNFDFDWHRHHLIYWDHNHPRPPGWWHERPDSRNTWLAGHPTGRPNVWRPGNRPGVVAGRGGDRGWSNPYARATTPVINRPGPRLSPPPHNVVRNEPIHNEPIRTEPPRQIVRPSPAPPVQHFAPPTRLEPTGPFIGIQNPRETRSFSERGQQSIQTMPHFNAPAAPSFHGGGNVGGGFHGGGGGGGGGHR